MSLRTKSLSEIKAELQKKRASYLEKADEIFKSQENKEAPWSGEDGEAAKSAHDECMKHFDDISSRIERCKDLIHREMGEAQELSREDDDEDVEMSNEDFGEDSDEMMSRFGAGKGTGKRYGFDRDLRGLRDYHEAKRYRNNDGIYGRMDYKSNRAPQVRGTAYVSREERSREPKGMRAVRFILGQHVAREQLSLEAGYRYIVDNFHDTEVAKALVQKDVSGAGNFLAATSTGGALLPQDFSSEWLDVLWSNVVIRELKGVDIMSAPMGQLTIARTSTTSAAQWDAPPQEGVNISVSNGTFDDIQMTTRRLTSQTPVSNQLLYQSPLGVATRVLRMMGDNISRAEDACFLGYPTNGVSGVGGVPLGLRTMITNYAPQNLLTFTGDFTVLKNVQNFLWSMVSQLSGQNVSLDGAAWIMHPFVKSYLASLTDSVGRPFYEDLQNQNNTGTLLGMPVKTTTNIPSNRGVGTYSVANASTQAYTTDIFLVQPRDVIIADTMRLETASSTEATILDTSNSNAVFSAFGRYATIFRVVEFVDFNMAHPMSVVCGNAPFTPSYVSNATLSNAAVTYSTQSPLMGNSSAGSATYTP